MAYALLAHPVAQKELDKLPPRIADGIRRVLRALCESPKDRRFDLKPLRALEGEPPALRLRIGEYRVILRIYHREREVRIARAGHRSAIYRGLTGIAD